MFRDIATLQDAVIAIACVASSQSQLQGHVSLSSSSGALSSFHIGAPNTSTGTVSSFLHYDFPADPDSDYVDMEAKVLSMLHCTKDSLIQNSIGESVSYQHPSSSQKRIYSHDFREDISGTNNDNKISSTKRIAIEEPAVRGEVAFDVIQSESILSFKTRDIGNMSGSESRVFSLWESPDKVSSLSFHTSVSSNCRNNELRTANHVNIDSKYSKDDENDAPPPETIIIEDDW